MAEIRGDDEDVSRVVEILGKETPVLLLFGDGKAAHQHGHDGELIPIQAKSYHNTCRGKIYSMAPFINVLVTIWFFI